MPELPEVETVKLQLQKYVIGHKLQKIEVRNRKIFQGDEKSIIGAKINAVRRFAKVLVIDLSNSQSLVIHIKLTGQLVYRGPNLKKIPVLSNKVVGGLGGRHTLVIFSLDKTGALYYNDVRRFGWIKIVDTSEVEKIDFIKKLGPEPPVTKSPLGQSRLTLDMFMKILTKTSRAIKVVIMDQSKIGGVGNIYANDALWLAEIDPAKKANKLNPDEVQRLFNSIEEVLMSGIKAGGASELAFVTPDGSEGNYQEQSLVYGKEGQICPRCGETKIKKIKLGGRGTYYCPKCQGK